jgi:hypothetical protein
VDWGLALAGMEERKGARVFEMGKGLGGGGGARGTLERRLIAVTSSGFMAPGYPAREKCAGVGSGLCQCSGPC